MRRATKDRIEVCEERFVTDAFPLAHVASWSRLSCHLSMHSSRISSHITLDSRGLRSSTIQRITSLLYRRKRCNFHHQHSILLGRPPYPEYGRLSRVFNGMNRVVGKRRNAWEGICGRSLTMGRQMERQRGGLLHLNGLNVRGPIQSLTAPRFPSPLRPYAQMGSYSFDLTSVLFSRSNATGLWVRRMRDRLTRC